MLKMFGKWSVWDANGCSSLEQLKKLVASNLLHMIERQVMVDKFQSGHAVSTRSKYLLTGRQTNEATKKMSFSVIFYLANRAWHGFYNCIQVGPDLSECFG
jgi:hypothetical protein